MAKSLPFELTKNEVLVAELERSKVPYVVMFGLGFLSTSFFFANFIQLYSASNSAWLRKLISISSETASQISPIFLLLSALSILFCLVAAQIYSQNRMFITNEHMVRIEQHGLVATDRKVINHLNVEDIKARQNLLGRLFGYGLMSLSTEGEGVTYTINFIKRPFEYERIITDTRDAYQQSVIDDGGQSIPLAKNR